MSLMITRVKSTCHKCDGNEFIITATDSAGYQNIVCKNCKTLNFRVGDNGITMDIQIPENPTKED